MRSVRCVCSDDFHEQPLWLRRRWSLVRLGALELGKADVVSNNYLRLCQTWNINVISCRAPCKFKKLFDSCHVSLGLTKEISQDWILRWDSGGYITLQQPRGQAWYNSSKRLSFSKLNWQISSKINVYIPSTLNVKPIIMRMVAMMMVEVH